MPQIKLHQHRGISCCRSYPSQDCASGDGNRSAIDLSLAVILFNQDDAEPVDGMFLPAGTGLKGTTTSTTGFPKDMTSLAVFPTTKAKR
ncbi:hypothetical protein VTI28DRAFT_8047 [Corynascus sepedonium]